MNIIHGNEDNFNELINSGEVLVDFFATWCGPCRMLSPVLEELSSDRLDVKIVKIDVDECPNIARMFGVMSIPTLILFKDGKEVAKENGFMPKEALVAWINNNR
ncbi:MAG: thioredoxin [Firmicutes bacterium]|nr:thioredoxin [Bacillota bacterium]